jgi:hypothetical protein
VELFLCDVITTMPSELMQGRPCDDGVGFRDDKVLNDIIGDAIALNGESEPHSENYLDAEDVSVSVEPEVKIPERDWSKAKSVQARSCAWTRL